MTTKDYPYGGKLVQDKGLKDMIVNVNPTNTPLSSRAINGAPTTTVNSITMWESSSPPTYDWETNELNGIVAVHDREACIRFIGECSEEELLQVAGLVMTRLENEDGER